MNRDNYFPGGFTAGYFPRYWPTPDTIVVPPPVAPTAGGGGGWSSVDSTQDDEECILLVLNSWLTLK